MVFASVFRPDGHHIAAFPTTRHSWLDTAHRVTACTGAALRLGLAAAPARVRPARAASRNKPITQPGSNRGAMGNAGADRHRAGQPHLSAGARARRAGALGHFTRGAAARISGVARPVGLRKIDPALSDRRLPADRGRPHPGRGQAGDGARSRPRHRVPAFRAVSLENSARQHALRSGAPGPAARRAREAGAGLHRPRRSDAASRTAIRRSSPAA